ncbi:Uncharacterized protein YwqG [Acinetobacter marinus]|uniref:Uncharacterized protein YwqG n=1 Tax=Acinetobacter marinus TaxID=281375 RepID=A0A1G6KWN0_9GAMM|nr:YwqG family protein [Acinetobacter marinus]SDC34865.1 Uncharacterized protein YwqG [Acinetobacter marinus]
MEQTLTQLPEIWQPFLDKIAPTKKDIVLMALTQCDDLALWQSKVGGDPYMPLDVKFPEDQNGQPLALLAQINFAEMPAHADFPTQGILQFFIGSDDLYGLDFDDQQRQDGFRVLYYEQVINDPAQLQQDFSAINAKRHADASLPFSGQYAIQFELNHQFISISDFSFASKIFAVDQLYDFEAQYGGDDLWQDMIEPYSEVVSANGHQLGGYPFFTQEDPRSDTPKWQNYQLLLQIDTDDAENDIMWGDSGVGNFFIDPVDLKNKDFSKVMYNWDCY